MLFAKLFARRDSRSPSRSFGPVKRPAAARRRTHRPPHVELLEDRTLLSGWVVDTVGTVDDPAGYAVAVDSSGNSYVTGDFEGTVDFDLGPGVSNLTSVGTVDIFIAKYSTAGALVWARRAGGTDPNWDGGKGITEDASGNVYVSGAFGGGTADFGSTTLTNAGGCDTFVTKLDAAGNFLWARGAGSAGCDVGGRITVDASGNIDVVGLFAGTVDFNPDPTATANLTSIGTRDVFIWKLDAGGNFIWAQRAAPGGGAKYLASDGASNIFVTGKFAGVGDFGPFNLTSAGDDDVFVTKLDSSGNFVWATRMGGTRTERYGGIGLDASGNVFVCGGFEGAANFGSITLTSLDTFQPGVPSEDVFVEKLDASGNVIWAKQLGGTSAEEGDALTMDANGNIYVMGNSYSTSMDFDPSSGTAFLSMTGYDPFDVKLDGNGNFLWARRMGGAFDSEWGRDIAVDVNGNVFTTGMTGLTGDFDTGSAVSTLTINGGPVFFLLKTTQDIPTTPQLARLLDSPDPILNGGGTLTLTANDIRVVHGASNVASVSFYRDKNGNGLLDVGTDTLLGTDSDGSNGWSLSLSVSLPKGQQQVTYTYFARAKDSANVVGNVVSTTNTVKKSRVAAMIVSRDLGQRSVDAVLASHYSDNDDGADRLTHRDHLGRHTLRDLLRARRLR